MTRRHHPIRRAETVIRVISVIGAATRGRRQTSRMHRRNRPEHIYINYKVIGGYKGYHGYRDRVIRLVLRVLRSEYCNQGPKVTRVIRVIRVNNE